MNEKMNETKKISFDYFVESYQACADENIKAEYLKDNLKIVTTYIPFNAKKACSESILQSSCVTTPSENQMDIKIDSCTKYISYIFTLIMVYTNLNISDIDISDGYDKLLTTGLSGIIMNKIPPKDKEEFDMVLQMVTEDFIANHCSTFSCIRTIMNQLLNSINAIEKTTKTKS